MLKNLQINGRTSIVSSRSFARKTLKIQTQMQTFLKRKKKQTSSETIYFLELLATTLTSILLKRTAVHVRMTRTMITTRRERALRTKKVKRNARISRLNLNFLINKLYSYIMWI